METEAEAPTAMLKRYRRCTGETLRRLLSLMSSGGPGRAGLSATDA